MFKDHKLSLILGIGWSITVTILLVLPGSAFPEENWMNRFQLDKLVHIVLFAILVFLWVNGLGKKYPTKSLHMNLCLGVTIVAIAYGIIMEFVQKYFVSNRAFELNDIFADAAGAIMGCLFLMGRYIKK